MMPGGGGASPIARVYVRMHCGRRRTTDKRARTARPRAPRLEDEVERPALNPRAPRVAASSRINVRAHIALGIGNSTRV